MPGSTVDQSTFSPRNWLLVLAIGGLGWLAGTRFGGTNRPAGEDTTAMAGAARAPSPLPAAHHGLDLLRAFAGAAPLHPDSISTWPPADLDVVVATLPDPYDSHLDWSFDTQLEAVRRGFEVNGFVVDRFWLPGPDSVTLRDGATQARLARREIEPGVLLLRRQREGGVDLRLLYLVGELPTSGIHRLALLGALQERRWLLDRKPGPRSHRLRIIGPTFSGSSLSLRQILADTLRNGLSRADTVSIVSGSATSCGNRETLTDAAGPVLEFSATVHPNESMTWALRTAVLRPMGIADSQVALIQEYSTQYGQSTVDLRSTAQPPSPKGLRTSLTRCDQPPPSPDSVPRFLNVPFPMSIASLRAEYLRNPTEAAPATSLPAAGPAPRLPLNLEDARRPREDIPITSRLTPAMLDLVVDEIVHRLVDHGVRAVGLLFTDVRDKLVLGAELRRRMRDVQLFTYESNTLYVRSDQNAAMRGMLVISTYSLAAETQWWTRPGTPQRMAFPSDAAEGAFNATLLQLGNPGAMLDYEPPLARVDSPRPPIWISTVGRDAFLPLAAVQDAAWSASYMAAGNSAGSGPRPPAIPRMGLLPFATVAAALGFLVILAGVAWSLRHRGSAADHNDMVLVSLDIHKGLYSILGGVALACVLTFTASFRLRLAGQSAGVPAWLWLALAGGAIAFTVIVVAAAPSIWLFLATFRQGAGHLRAEFKKGLEKGILWTAEIAGRWLVTAFGIAFIVLTVRFVGDIWRLGSTREAPFQLYFHRAGEIGSLASPLLPPILAGVGYAVWCAWHLWRVGLLRRKQPFEIFCEQASADPDRARNGLTGLARALSDVRWRLLLVVPTIGGFGVLLILVIGLIWLLGSFGGTMESISLGRPGLTTFDWILRGSVAAALFSIAWATCRFLLVWSALDRGLEAIQTMPLGAALDRLPSGVRSLARLRLPRVGQDQLAAPDSSPHRGEKEKAEPRRRETPAWELLADRETAELDRISREIAIQPAVLDALRAMDPRLAQALGPEQASVDRSEPVTRLVRLYEALRVAWTVGPQSREHKLLARWVDAAEDLLALRLVTYFEWAAQQLRVLALFLLLSLVLAIALLTGYPFYPRHLVMVCFMAVLLVAVGAVLYVNVRMSRDDTLSRVAKTTPGKISWNANFIGNLVTFGAIPLLTLLGSEFPGIRNALFSWAKPLLDALMKP